MSDELVLPEPESVAINLLADELDRQEPRTGGVYAEINGPPHGQGRYVCVPKPEFLAMEEVYQGAAGVYALLMSGQTPDAADWTLGHLGDAIRALNAIRYPS